jgi:signal transduction histidine kinase/ligand-binding sensor domain-containing protein/DNA-binding response OmpR family regulator
MCLREILLVVVIAFLHSCFVNNTQVSGEANVVQITQNLRLSTSDISFLDVSSFAQDSLGYMWMATLGGLNRYNGYEFQHFLHDSSDSTSLLHDFVLSLLIDSSQNFWVGTSNGVSSFDLRTNRFSHYTGGMTSVYSFFEDHTGQIWAATLLGPGIVDRERKNVIFPWEPQAVNLFWEDNSHRLWMGLNEEQGLAVRKDQSSWEYYTLPGKRSVTCIYADPQDTWWLGTNAGIVLFDPVSRTFKDPEISVPENTKLNKTQINFIKEVEPLKLLIGTTTEGFFYYDILSKHLQHNTPARFNPFNSSQLHTCYINRQGNAWIGTYDKGFIIGNKQSDCFNIDQVLSHLFKEKFVTRIIEDKNNHFWIATRYDGLYRYSPSKGFETFKNLFPEKNEFLEVIFIDSMQRIWIAFETQLIIANITDSGHVNIIKRMNIGNVRTIKEDSGKNIWLGTWKGLFKIGFVNEQVTIDKIYSSNIPDICILDSGDILFSSFGEGLFKIVKDDTVPQLLDFPERVNPIAATCVTLYEDAQHRIWIGSYGNGTLCYLDGVYKSFSKDNGLPSNNVLCFQEDGLTGDIWMSTSHGISRLKVSTNDTVITNFFKTDGALGDQYHEKAGCRSSDGRIFFAGNHGLTFFNPSSILPNNDPPLVNIEDLKIFHQSVQPAGQGSVLKENIAYTEKIILNHKQTTISLDYAGLDFSAPNKLTYKYKLEGFDRQWNYAGNFRRATYSNLPPGKYMFYVSAINGDGIESVHPAYLQITVKPAPWFSWQAWLCYAVLLIATTFFALRFLFNTKINRQLMEQEHNERIREKEISKMKINFFTNISHEFRTPLTLISAPLEKLYAAVTLDENNLKLLDTVYRNVHRMLQLINQLLDFVKIENGVLLLNVQQDCIIQKLRNIYESFLYLAERKDIKLLFDPHITNQYVWIDTDKIEKIMYNLLSNAIKHTPENGIIEIFTCLLNREESIQKYGSNIQIDCSLFVEITVSDTGPGIPENKLQELFIRYRQINGSSGANPDYSGSGIGLHYTKTLIESHKGQIRARVKPDKGMEFSFIIPANDVYTEKDKGETKKDVFTLGFPKGQPVLKKNPGGLSQKQCYSVLIVEDNIELMDFISALLSEEYYVIEASNGDKAWEVLQSKSPDLILSDVLMPGISGYELCSQIKTCPEYCHIPVVLLTAKTSMPDQIEGLELGANAYICKPFNTDYLLLTISNLLKNKDILRQYFSTPRKDAGGDAMPVTLMRHDQLFMDKLTSLLENKLSDPNLNIDYIARELGFSRTAFYRKIKGLADISPNDFLRNYRLKCAAEKILNDSASLIEISEQTGFSSYSYFSKSFKKHYGVTPKDYGEK